LYCDSSLIVRRYIIEKKGIGENGREENVIKRRKRKIAERERARKRLHF
jgi:hypothetical protein